MCSEPGELAYTPKASLVGQGSAIHKDEEDDDTKSLDTSYKMDPVLGLQQHELFRSSRQHQGDAALISSPEDRTETRGSDA